MPYPPRFNMAYLITEAILVSLLVFENTYHLRMVYVYCAPNADHVLKQPQLIFKFYFRVLQMERVYCITVPVTTILIYLYLRNGPLDSCMDQFSLLYVSWWEVKNQNNPPFSIDSYPFTFPTSVYGMHSVICTKWHIEHTHSCECVCVLTHIHPNSKLLAWNKQKDLSWPLCVQRWRLKGAVHSEPYFFIASTMTAVFQVYGGKKNHFSFNPQQRILTFH